MNPIDHNKLLGWLFLGLGGLELVSNLFALAYIPLSFGQTMEDLRRFQRDIPWWIEEMPKYLLILVIVSTILFTIPKLIAAFGILKEKSWGRIAGIVAGGLSLIGIPVGTALGVYAIWFLTSDQGKSFYLGAGNPQLPDSTMNRPPI